MTNDLTPTEPSESPTDPSAPLARPIEVPPHDAGSARREAALRLLLVAMGLAAFFVLREATGLDDWLRERSEALAIYTHLLGNGLAAMALLALVLRRDPSPQSRLGLERVATGPALGWGLLAIPLCYAANLVVSTLYLAATRRDLFDVARDKVDALEPVAPIGGAGIVAVAVFVGVYEEVLFRGFVLSGLRAVLGSTSVRTAAAVGFSAALFGAAHFYQGTLGMFQTGAVGLVLGAVAVARRGVWPCIIAHVGIDLFGLALLRFIRPLLDDALRAATQPALLAAPA